MQARTSASMAAASHGRTASDPKKNHRAETHKAEQRCSCTTPRAQPMCTAARCWLPHVNMLQLRFLQDERGAAHRVHRGGWRRGGVGRGGVVLSLASRKPASSKPAPGEPCCSEAFLRGPPPYEPSYATPRRIGSTGYVRTSMARGARIGEILQYTFSYCVTKKMR